MEIQSNKECWFCKTTHNLHKHHIFYGSNRKVSDRNGLVVWLCATHHNMSDNSVHFNKKMDIKLKKYAQKKYEEKHTREDFIKLIGRNYLDE